MDTDLTAVIMLIALKTQLWTLIYSLSVVVIYFLQKGGLSMSKQIVFTQEQIEILEGNIYTHHVSSYCIVFTVAFKVFFASQVDLPQMTTQKIMRAAGYDPSLFSRSCLDGIRKRILKEARSPEGFKEPRGISHSERTALFAEKDLAKQRMDTSIRELQERIVRLEKQVEFLKKTSHVRNRQK